MKKGLLTMAGVLLTVSLVSAGTTVPVLAEEETTLVYGSGDYTRINPAMDEHGEINILIFNGLTAHDGDNQVVPGLAESWDFDDETNTYTFHMVEDAKWQDGEPVTAEDVKFTIEAIMDPENGSENAPNYEDVEEINVIDDHTVAFKLEDKNVAFLDYMTMAVLPKHLLEGEDMQIFVDADACPVVGIVEKVAKEHNLPVTLLCDTNHVLSSDYSEVIVVGAGADAVDYKLISICHRGDIVVSQDYGVAAMALGKNAYAIHQSGKWYTNENIDQMLMERHLNKKARRASRKNHLKGPRKRISEDDEHFRESFEKMIHMAMDKEK